MEAKISKKSYYLPDILVNLFKEWCKPGRDYSPKIAGAILYYMSLEPNVRDLCEKAAYGTEADIKKKIKALKLPYDINDPSSSIAFVNAQTEKAEAAANKKHRAGTKSA